MQRNQSTGYFLVCLYVCVYMCVHLCVCVCVIFFQTVIVTPMAQSVIAVMAQDIVNVRRALQGPSVGIV